MTPTDIIGTKPKERSDDLPLFAPAPEPVVSHPTGHRRRVPTHPAERLAAFADLGRTDVSDAMLDDAALFARPLLERQGHLAVWEARLILIREGITDGTEPASTFGRLWRVMGLKATGSVCRVPLALPTWAYHNADGMRVTDDRLALMQDVLDRAHANRQSVFRLPTAAERATHIALAEAGK